MNKKFLRKISKLRSQLEFQTRSMKGNERSVERFNLKLMRKRLAGIIAYIAILISIY